MDGICATSLKKAAEYWYVTNWQVLRALEKSVRVQQNKYHDLLTLELYGNRFGLLGGTLRGGMWPLIVHTGAERTFDASDSDN